jgi:hypothetical protein
METGTGRMEKVLDNQLFQVVVMVKKNYCEQQCVKGKY